MLKRTLRSTPRALLALIIGIGFIVPLWITLCTSLDTPADVFTFPPHLWLDFQWGVYQKAWGMFHWMIYFRNTILIAVMTIALSLTTSVLAAYSLSFLNFRGRDLVFTLILIVFMIPGETYLIPNFVIIAKLKLVDTLISQVLPYGATAFGIFLLRQFFLTIPKDYFEAARMDGCGHLRFLWSIALPLSRPILFTISLYIFIGCWNSLLWPLMVTQSESAQPIEVAVANYLTTNSADWQGLSAASIFTTLPIIVVYLFLQKYIIRGISRGDGVRM